jgi:hypothetical protein
MSIYRWMSYEGVFAENVHDHFMQYGRWIKGKKWNQNKYLVWIATIWYLWETRNKIVFEGKYVSFNNVVFKIKLLSWN